MSDAKEDQVINWETGKSDTFDRMLFLHAIGAADMLNRSAEWDIRKWQPPKGCTKNPHTFTGAECLVGVIGSWRVGGHPHYTCSKCGYVSWSDIAGECPREKP